MALFNTKQVNRGVITLLPNEVIYTILRYVSIPDLLIMTRLLNQRISCLAHQVLLEKLTSTKDCHLRLCFDQENHWRFTVDFKFTRATKTRLAFTPVKSVSLRMYTSKFLRKPILHKVSFVGPDFTIENEHLASNLIKSPISFDIKQVGLQQQVYAQQVLFAFKVTRTPENVIKARSGERWVEPLGFECSFEFLAQTKNKIQKVFDILHNKPVRRQIDGKAFTTSTSYSVMETRKLYPFEKSMRLELMPIIGGLHTSTTEISY
ncbi:hypothetical protein BDF21DRAFT_431295 [Thamnidium elegans]|nr:hypothetical protein BDF21DRAFT_431295 [Thamnidium elegans]